MIGPHGRAAGRQGRSACKTSRPASIRVSFTHLARCVNGDAYNMRTVLRLQQNVFTHLDSTQTATKCDSGYDSLIRFLICHIDMPYWYAPYWKDISTTSLTSGSLHRLVICFRESIRLFHGMSKRFVLSFSNDLGHINLINLQWLYDHDINPLDPFKVCVLLCSDKIHLQNVAITSLHSPKTTNKIQL